MKETQYNLVTIDQILSTR